MKFLIPILIVGALIFFQYCKTTQYTPDDYPSNQIVFGSGGGVTGAYIHFYLFDNGELFKNSTTDKNFTKVKKVRKDQVSQIFNNYESLKLNAYSLDDPGNMNHYIEFKKDGKSHKFQWGGNNEEVNPNLKTIYQILNNLTKTQ